MSEMAPKQLLPFLFLVPILLLLNVCKEAMAVKQLRRGFYSESCPAAESTVRKVIQRAMVKDPRSPASVMRLQFHDCFVNVFLFLVLYYASSFYCCFFGLYVFTLFFLHFFFVNQLFLWFLLNHALCFFLLTLWNYCYFEFYWSTLFSLNHFIDQLICCNSWFFFFFYYESNSHAVIYIYILYGAMICCWFWFNGGRDVMHLCCLMIRRRCWERSSLSQILTHWDHMKWLMKPRLSLKGFALVLFPVLISSSWPQGMLCPWY